MITWIMRLMFATASVITSDNSWLFVWALFEIWNELNDIEKRIK